MTVKIKKMKPSDKKKWTTALRSGEYKQGAGWLVTDDPDSAETRRSGAFHCCLGVAQCVLGKRPPRMGVTMLRAGKFGLQRAVQNALASANDGEVCTDFKDLGVPQPKLRNGKASFGAIANWIDKYL